MNNQPLPTVWKDLGVLMGNEMNYSIINTLHTAFIVAKANCLLTIMNKKCNINFDVSPCSSSNPQDHATP